MFLLFAELLEIHQNQILLYGGTKGIRDGNLLRSALGAPSATYDGQYLHTDIYEMAASYLFHLVKNHPFIDGNKRVGVVATSTFLFLNGYNFSPPDKDLLETVLLLAQGKISKAEIAVFIRKWTTKL